MRKHWLIGFMVMVMFNLLPLYLLAQVIETTGSTAVMGGEYNVMNNVWGASTAQRLEVDLDSTYFRVILSEHNNTGGTPASYPAIFKGNHWGWATTVNNPMPKIITEIGSAPFTWVIDTAGVAGTWNCAFESWFNEAGTGTNYTGELMIWINYHGGAGPGGSRVATVDIGGHTWDVYYALWDWNYIAYKITTITDSVSLDLRDFIYDALTRGYLCTPWYLVNMEAGFEIWRDGQGLATFSYAADVIEGVSDENFSPVPFNLLSPSNKKNLTSMVIQFKWQQSVDPNLDPVEYIFHLFGDNVDTTITNLDADSLTFDGTNSLQSYTTYTWYVEATDGIDTVASSAQRTLRTPRLTEVEGLNQLPNRFFLGQNYPNPFNPTTTISFSLAAMDIVTLRIYDTSGVEIATLLNQEKQSAGEHRIAFDSAGLPSGVYFYRLQTSNYLEAKKMVLTR